VPDRKRGLATDPLPLSRRFPQEDSGGLTRGKRRQRDGAEVDDSALGLKADPARPDLTVHSLVDQLPVHHKGDPITICRDLVPVPLTGLVFVPFDFAQTPPYGDLGKPFLVAADLEALESVHIPGVSTLQLCLHGVRQHGGLKSA